MQSHFTSIDLVTLTIRLLWASAVPIVAGLNDQLTPELALSIGVWVLVSLLPLTLALFGAQWSRRREFALAADFAFSLVAITVTGLAISPLWWSLLVGGLLGGISFGWLSALAFPTLGASLLIAIGYLAGLYQAEELGSLGRAMLTIVVLTPAVGTAGVWLRRYLSDEDSLNPTNNRAFMEMAVEMSSATSDDVFSERIVKLAVAGLDPAAEGSGNQRLEAALLVPREGGYRVAAGPTYNLDDPTLIANPGEPLGEAIDSESPRRVEDPSRDPVLPQIGMIQAVAEAVYVPLVMNGRAEGALVMAHPKNGYFNDERLELLRNIGTQAAIALHNARVVHALEKERDRITETEEEARRKLARDLHDGPTQTIAAIAMRLNFAGRLVDRDQEAAQEEIKTLEDIARQTTREIRHMLFTLRPLVLESKGLVATLYQLATKLYETHGQEVQVDAVPAVADELEMSKQAVVFFIAEEAINNAHKHAEAAHIWVELKRTDEDQIALDVRDDGVGFNVGEVDANYEQRGSLGMVNMRERSELVNGVLRIESAEGEGTHITLIVPLGGSNG